MNFKEKYDIWLKKVNQALQEYVVVKQTPEKNVYESMRYSLMAGGKRLRPVMALAVCDLFDVNVNKILPYACAIEMIHTYSLIHDDLPAMDNDDYRRGRLTNHKVYGEAMAVLTGDALLNYAFEIMLNDVLSGDLEEKSYSMASKIRAMSLIANASGVSGMIGGQVVDLESEGKDISKELLDYMHKCKTGAMIKVSLLAAAAICNAKEDEFLALEKYSEKIGLAFQIKDDILDVEGNLEALGKMVGSDEANNKSTFVSLYGLEESKKILNNITDEAIDALEVFGDKSEFLKELALYLVKREN